MNKVVTLLRMLCSACASTNTERCVTCIFKQVGKIEVETPTAVRLAIGERRQWRPYSSSLLNYANHVSQATRPANCGSAAALFRIFSEEVEANQFSVQRWEQFYEQSMVTEEQTGKQAMERAGVKLYDAVQRIREELNQISQEECNAYVHDLIINKSFIGLGIQEAVLRKIAALTKRTYRASTIEEEKNGIDGFLDEQPVSVKPASYRQNQSTSRNTMPSMVILYALCPRDVTLDQLHSIAAQYDIALPRISNPSKQDLWDILLGNGNILFWEQQ